MSYWGMIPDMSGLPSNELWEKWRKEANLLAPILIRRDAEQETILHWDWLRRVIRESGLDQEENPEEGWIRFWESLPGERALVLNRFGELFWLASEENASPEDCCVMLGEVFSGRKHILPTLEFFLKRAPDITKKEFSSDAIYAVKAKYGIGEWSEDQDKYLIPLRKQLLGY